MRRMAPLPVRPRLARLGDLVRSHPGESIALVHLAEMHIKRGRQGGVGVEHSVDT